MIKFYSALSPRQVIKQDLSNRFVERFDFSRDKEGKVIIVSIGKIDVQSMIQSYGSEAGVYSILARVSRTGDMSALSARKGVYADISAMPNNIHDAAAIVDSVDFLKKKAVDEVAAAAKAKEVSHV